MNKQTQSILAGIKQRAEEMLTAEDEDGNPVVRFTGDLLKLTSVIEKVHAMESEESGKSGKERTVKLLPTMPMRKQA